MELKTILFLLSDLALILSGYVYGWKFLKKRNVLLGLEWWIIGFPMIAVIGTMVITHRYRPSALVDIVLFALSFAGAFVLMHVDAVQAVKPWFYLVMAAVFSVFLVYFAMRLLAVGERLNALNLMVVLVTTGTIAVMDDFFPLPGDDADRTLFFTIAMAVWAYMVCGYYYAYCALERAEKRR